MKDPMGAEAMRAVMKPLVEANTINIDKLVTLCSNQHKQIMKLEQEVDDLQQLTRNKTLVIAGISEEIDAEKAAIDVCNKLKVNLHPEHIDSVMRVGKKDDNRPRNILLTVITQRKKVQILREKKSLRHLAERIFINESLTPKRGALFAVTRKAAKEKKIFSTWTREGRIYIKLGENDNPKMIKAEKELVEIIK